MPVSDEEADAALAEAHFQSGRWSEAAALYGRLLDSSPGDFTANLRLGTILCSVGRGDEAIPYLDRCAGQRPDVAEVFYQRGNARAESGNPRAAIADLQAALALEPDFTEALTMLGSALQLLNRHREVLDVLDRLDKLLPNHKAIQGHYLHTAQALCDWAAIERLRPRLEAQVASGEAVVSPQTMLMSFADPGLLHSCAVHFQRDLLAGLPEAAPFPPHARHGKIRLAYISADFQDHATSLLISDLIARHDRARFQVIGVSSGMDDGGKSRAWLKRTFDQFLDIRGVPDMQAVDKLRKMEIDIAVDLNGHTRNARNGILALRAAPVQVNFLGFPCTMGADFMDYIIADPVVLPREDRRFYSEKVVYLPHSYQPNGPNRQRLAPFPRKSYGLPEQGFVFCSFNSHFKITEAVFDIWMRLLAHVPGSVLWLLRDSGDETLRREAQRRGIDPARLVFAPRTPVHLHLARLAMADLALDTMPCNGHTTTSDALWMGVPVITCPGRSFTGRVSASLLKAAEMPELAVETLQDYAACALELARERSRLEALRRRLDANRSSAPLWDAQRYCDDIEKAFTVMAEKSRGGHAPEGFDV